MDNQIDPKKLVVYIAKRETPAIVVGYFDYSNCGDCSSIQEMIRVGTEIKFQKYGYVPLAWSEVGHTKSGWEESFKHAVSEGQTIEKVDGKYIVKMDTNKAMIKRDGPAKAKEVPKAVVAEDKDLSPAFFGNLMKEGSFSHQVPPAFGSSQ